jgi:[ribosomal protein S18]-alanine N-acetyltransferase
LPGFDSRRLHFSSRAERALVLPRSPVDLRIEPATAELFAERGSWRYPPPFDFYNDDGLSPNNPERFYSVSTSDGAIAGFFYFEERGGAIFLGLGLRPDLTGRGLGPAFVSAGVDFARALFGPKRIVLDVAGFNERAIRAYERAGFRQIGSHIRYFEGWGDVTFVDMELWANGDAD